MPENGNQAVRIHDPGNEKPVTELWAVLSVDEDGNEGICAAFVSGIGVTQLVTADPALLCFLRAHAAVLAANGTKTIRIVKFTARETVETVSP